MPMFMDLHNVPAEITPKDVAMAHLQDVDLFLARGEAALKGFDDPVRVYEVPWRESQ
jgi:class 3 adenylate cyclase